MKTRLGLIVGLVLMALAGVAEAQQEPKPWTILVSHEFTSSDGKKLKADLLSYVVKPELYQGRDQITNTLSVRDFRIIRDKKVMIKPNGAEKPVELPVSRLSKDDQKMVELLDKRSPRFRWLSGNVVNISDGWIVVDAKSYKYGFNQGLQSVRSSTVVLFGHPDQKKLVDGAKLNPGRRPGILVYHYTKPQKLGSSTLAGYSADLTEQKERELEK